MNNYVTDIFLLYIFNENRFDTDSQINLTVILYKQITITQRFLIKMSTYIVNFSDWHALSIHGAEKSRKKSFKALRLNEREDVTFVSRDRFLCNLRAKNFHYGIRGITHLDTDALKYRGTEKA